jgi:hypothetical protein
MTSRTLATFVVCGSLLACSSRSDDHKPGVPRTSADAGANAADAGSGALPSKPTPNTVSSADGGANRTKLGDADAATSTGGRAAAVSPCAAGAPSAWMPLSSARQPSARMLPMPRGLATEHGMLLLGGHPRVGAPAASESGGIYDLCADAWTPIVTAPFSVDTLQATYTPIVACTGDELLVWGGYEMTPTWTGYAEGMAVAIANRFDVASSNESQR